MIAVNLENVRQIKDVNWSFVNIIGKFLEHLSMRSNIVYSVLILILNVPFVQAQVRVDYMLLANMNRQPEIYFEHNIIPEVKNDSLVSYINFRINNNFLNFMRIQPAEATNVSQSYIADIEISFDLFHDQITRRNDPQITAGRNTWSNKVYASSFEEISSNELFTAGKIQLNLPPGKYRLQPTIRVNGQTVQAGTTVQNASKVASQRSRRNSDRRIQGISVEIPEMIKNKALVYFIDPLNENLKLLNFGNNVHYAQDFSIVLGLPKDMLSADVNINSSSDRSSSNDVIWSINSDDMEKIVGGVSSISKNDDGLFLNLENETDFQFYKITVPNHLFVNSYYTLEVKENTNTIFSRRYLTRWLDIPTSLLNLDVAIDMMKFILDSDEIKELRRGNEKQREEKFVEFWKSRDPTPESAYNELMTEFYSRIDYAFKNFSSPNKAGYESDQGKLHIRLGKPDNIERRFPPSGPVTEVWQYGSRTFIFTATTGFGDFVLKDS